MGHPWYSLWCCSPLKAGIMGVSLYAWLISIKVGWELVDGLCPSLFQSSSFPLYRDEPLALLAFAMEIISCWLSMWSSYRQDVLDTFVGKKEHSRIWCLTQIILGLCLQASTFPFVHEITILGTAEDSSPKEDKMRYGVGNCMAKSCLLLAI